MDVQMPVIDGYRTTHLIRHHDPYKRASGTIPIVAMTASAIQGDREKCMRAGMDDYIAKPVKGSTLERTLDRWAAQGRRAAEVEGGDAGSECNEDGAHRCQEEEEVLDDGEERELERGVERLAEALTEGQELTEENVGRLEREEAEERRRRPQVKRWPDSQRTITGL
jgi:CheY-like chemotaxis protein